MLDNILNLFVNTAYADTAANTVQSPPGGGMVSMFAMVAIVVLFMYFGRTRPQTQAPL